MNCSLVPLQGERIIPISYLGITLGMRLLYLLVLGLQWEAGRTLVTHQDYTYPVQEARATSSFGKPHVIWMWPSAD